MSAIYLMRLPPKKKPLQRCSQTVDVESFAGLGMPEWK